MNVTLIPMDTAIIRRKEKLAELANFLQTSDFRDQFIEAYIADTAFTIQDIIKREIETPSILLKMQRSEESLLEKRLPIGTVAIFIPKNSLGLTVAKAIASSYLAGNRTLVYFPAALKKTAPIYAHVLTTFLDSIEIADFSLSSAQFLRSNMKNPDIKAFVIYGDDSWIDAYKVLAKENRKKVIFEGPGNDPMIVFRDADIDKAVAGAIEAGLMNGGQSCSATERFFIHESIYTDFCQKLALQIAQLKVGAARNPSTNVGPILSKAIFSRIVRQINESVEMGATVIAGGKIEVDPETGYSILHPTLLCHCTAKMSVVKDETFGPVFPLVSFQSEEELLTMLDQTNYGLNACAFGRVSPAIKNYLIENHRNVYFNSTQASPQNIASRLMDGGFRRSGMIWDFEHTGIETTGIRVLALELSKESIE